MSPLRRAIETAWRLFSHSLQFTKMKFIILPMLRENMHTVCDVPISFESVLSEWNHKFPQGIDCSLFRSDKPLDWFYDDLNTEAQFLIE